MAVSGFRTPSYTLVQCVHFNIPIILFSVKKEKKKRNKDNINL